MNTGQLLGVVGMAMRDALGPHGGQADLQSRWERERDRGKRLQVVGHIDLHQLELTAGNQIADVVAAGLAREVPTRDAIMAVLRREYESLLAQDPTDPEQWGRAADAVSELFGGLVIKPEGFDDV